MIGYECNPAQFKEVAPTSPAPAPVLAAAAAPFRA